MALSQQDKDEIVERVVAILRAPDRQAQLEALRAKLAAGAEDPSEVDDAVYSVVQAIDELYG